MKRQATDYLILDQATGTYREDPEQMVRDDVEKHYWLNVGRTILKDWRLYVMLVPMLLVFLFWRYMPMYELLGSFKVDDVVKPVADQYFKGFSNFKGLLMGTGTYAGLSTDFWRAMRNTFLLSFYGLLFGFPMPIILALFFNEIRSNAARSALQVMTYLPKFMSTVVMTSLVVMLIFSAFAAYPLSRMKFRFRNLIYAGIVAMMSIPMHVTLIPIFKMTTSMGLYDKLISLLGPYVAFALPMSVFILTGFMMTIPKEIEESAEIDGCNKYNNFFQIILPLAKSGLSTLAIYNGVSMWNEFAFANTLLQSPAQKTLPLALGQFKGEHSLDMPMILAVLVLSALPMIILFIIFQDKLVKGMMAGAVKG